MSKILTLLLSLPLAFAACAHDKPKATHATMDALMVNGNATMSTRAPDGWAVDEPTARRLGVCTAYVVEGTEFDTSPAVIYPRAGDFVGQEGVDKEVKSIASFFKNANPAFKLEKQPNVTSKKGLNFQVYFFMEGPRTNRYEAVAYTIVKNHIFASVYSAMKPEDFQAHLKSFYESIDALSEVEVNLHSYEGKCLYQGPDGKLESHDKKKREVPFMSDT